MTSCDGRVSDVTDEVVVGGKGEWVLVGDGGDTRVCARRETRWYWGKGRVSEGRAGVDAGAGAGAGAGGSFGAGQGVRM